MAVVEPAGHAYPAAHGPLQVADVRPSAAPYRPGAHGPLQFAVNSTTAAPYNPAVQLLHTPAPPALYCPAVHGDDVPVDEPAGHENPAGHEEQVDEPTGAYCPALHLCGVPVPAVGHM